MGICYTSIAMYGKRFHTRSEIEEFVTSRYPNAEVDYEGIFETGIAGEVQEYPGLEDLVIESLNLYKDADYLFGYNMKLGETIDAYKAKWDLAFPGETAETHLETQVG